MIRRWWSRLVSPAPDPDPYTRLDRLGGLPESRFPVARPHSSPTPLFDETVLATGVLPGTRAEERAS